MGVDTPLEQRFNILFIDRFNSYLLRGNVYRKQSVTFVP